MMETYPKGQALKVLLLNIASLEQMFFTLFALSNNLLLIAGL